MSSVQTSDEKENRRLRNRLSQQAFRRRQAQYIRQLQTQVNSASGQESDIIRDLQNENTNLRNQLVEVQSKLSRIIVTMQGLSGSITTVLDGCVEGNPDGNEVESGETEFSLFTEDHPVASVNGVPRAVLPALDTIQTSIILDSSPAQLITSTSTLETGFPDGASFPQQIPNIWTFEYQMGTEPYNDALLRSQLHSLMLGKQWTATNSPFSDHIQVLRSLLQSKLKRLPQAATSWNSTHQQVLMVLSLFNSITRPDAMAWYAKTKFYHVADLTTWQICPCPQTFDRVHPHYRPTNMQKQLPYPAVIDWIPFQTIRDRLIQNHAANPHIDQIFCDAVSSYAVESCMSDIIAGAPAVKAYLRVRDLLQLEFSATAESETSETDMLPAPNVEALFSSPTFSRAVFKHLNMDRGASYYKIDPAFFGKYPELYDPNADIMAQGVPLKPEVQLTLTYPPPVDDPTFQIYYSFIEFTINAQFNAEYI
ncbi:hypothetical protein PT974_03233 [Cladobotryum mycophilum]|uniref:BZIP domain-containing protein n=1 Tax=Cladobotryum mycophilum TaxID=491253 RepID=A0ABR0SSD3_9HYPO